MSIVQVTHILILDRLKRVGECGHCRVYLADGMRNAECGLQVAVKYCITVYLHAENNCCISMFSPCRSFDNPVAKCFPSENAPFRGSIYSVRYGSLCRIIGHSASVFRAQDNSVSGKLGNMIYIVY